VELPSIKLQACRRVGLPPRAGKDPPSPPPENPGEKRRTSTVRRSIPPLAEAPPMGAAATPFPGQLRDETPPPDSTGAMLSRPAYGWPSSVIVTIVGRRPGCEKGGSHRQITPPRPSSVGEGTKIPPRSTCYPGPLKAKTIVKVHRVFPSGCGYGASSPRIQLRWNSTGDSRTVVGPFARTSIKGQWTSLP